MYLFSSEPLNSKILELDNSWCSVMQLKNACDIHTIFFQANNEVNLVTMIQPSTLFFLLDFGAFG